MSVLTLYRDDVRVDEQVLMRAVVSLGRHPDNDRDPVLLEKGLRNYWGYSTVAFFAPKESYSSRKRPGVQVSEFKAMVRALPNSAATRKIQ